jgi:tRNA(Ile)-lysidine synthase
MADRTELAVRETARELIPSRSHILAAVSGGGDSVALLHLLLRQASSLSLRIDVAHLDHGLRRGSRTDRRFVEALAETLGLVCISERRELDDLRRKGESPEEASRRVRRAFLMSAAKRTGAQLIATGHTLDDQAETIMLRLVRGAGATALSGMARRGPGPFVRPLLGIEREALRDYLSRKGLAYRDDPSNKDLRFDRNRVRKLILPLLKDELNPRAARHLVKAAQHFREDAIYLDGLASTLTDRITRHDRHGRLVLALEELLVTASPIATRVARLALQRAGADARRISTRHIAAVLELASGPRGRKLNLPSRIIARRDGKRILFDREAGEDRRD